METLTSVWAPGDPCDLVEAPCKWEACVFNRAPPAGVIWSEQLSHHLQTNKQLQDTLLQREEQLSRLQEENNKLREFLNSSFVRNVREKRKLSRKLKRNLASDQRASLQNVALPASPQVSKRVCRNLTAEFCSESPASSEPALDLWVLRTLGLKDRDTIDACQQVLEVTPPPSSRPAGSGPEVPLSCADWTPQDPGTPVHMSPQFSQPPPFCSTPWSPLTPRDTPVSPPHVSALPSPVHSQSGGGPSRPSDLAFSMALSPSSSVKTHSFPQGQAFVRKDPVGRWNFTWVPALASHNALG
ncbi:geminin coiled-coil domain-containing protein 1 [Entelurus aequoreus]|uniref:geminin coiled-coil domain-containing protein 1 n=1 Tax=Entelurus aequoreus TaxID=161455 RepID=UPI002B1D4D44|nr:geminin coiled-coil domain-containing protein 1 [Entelurus aequoreus]